MWTSKSAHVQRKAKRWSVANEAEKMAKLATGPRVGAEDTGPVGSEGSDVVKSCVGVPRCPLASLPQPCQRPGPLGEEPAAVEHSTVTAGSLRGEVELHVLGCRLT